MPLYEISHSFPLTRKLKDQLAKQITELHATTFTTPSLFVNVHFKDIDATAENYYIAGSTRVGGINRITGMVRTAESRTKKDFDSLSEKIEGIWNSVVRGLGDEAEDKDGNKKKVDETDKEKEAKRLHAVFLYQMVAARESGITIPTAGEEKQWLQSNMSEFKNRAESKGDQDMIDMLQEIEDRPDLKKLMN